jgi:hypothetical protein
MPASLTAVSDRCVEGSHLLNGVWKLFGRSLEMFIKTIVTLPPSIRANFLELLPEVFAHEWVGV